jgi:RNA polymerase sigma factor (sigma-70 family)
MARQTSNPFTAGQKKPDANLAFDDEGLQALYKHNYAKTEAFVVANSGTADEAKDVYQEAFIAVWQNLRTGRFVQQDGKSLEAYLFQIAKFKWYDHLKTAKKIRAVPADDDAFVELPYNEEAESYMAQVEQHFKTLGEPCKQVLTLFYFQKQSMSAIAAKFLWTEATAKNNKYRCLQRLRNAVVGTTK